VTANLKPEMKKGILNKDKCQAASANNEQVISKGFTTNISAPVDCEQKQEFKNRILSKSIGAGSSDNKVPDIPPLVKVETFFSQWYTIDTLRVIKGDNFVRDVLRENDCTVSSVVAAVGVSEEESILKNTAFREKYIQLCRKLDLQDLEDSQWDKQELNNSTTIKTSQHSNSTGTVKYPMPSYDQLRQKTEVEMQKISSYFKGKTEYSVEDKRNEIKHKVQ
jgi:hypothetical protein